MQLRGRHTLEAVGQILGVSQDQVRAFIDPGPLIARDFGEEGLFVEHEDLIAFRRPHPASAFPGYSALCKPTGESSEGGKASPHPAAERDRGEATATAPAARHLRLVRR